MARCARHHIAYLHEPAPVAKCPDQHEFEPPGVVAQEAE